MTTQTTILHAQGLTEPFNGHTVLHGVDLRVARGESVSVMGPSGSGKSTLLYNVSGMDTMTSGTVLFARQELGSLNQKEQARLRLTSMGFIFQHVALAEEPVPARQRSTTGVPGRPGSAEELNARALGLMERTGVAGLAERDISEASGGQLQRVGICRALIHGPLILFGDEPTGALDSTASAEIMDILGELNAEGNTVMLVTNDVKVAARTYRVLYMVDGRIVRDREQGRYDGTRLDDRHADVAEWLLEPATV